MGLFGQTKINKKINLQLEKMLRTNEQKEVLEKAISLYHEGKYQEALLGFEGIEGDDIEVFFYIAMCRLYDQNNQYRKLDILAMLKRCAEHEYVPAFSKLAALYEDGEGFYNDKDKAIYWYKKGVDSHCPECQFALGRKYINGTDVKTDVEKGMSYLEKAAEQQHVKALYLLALHYDSGTIKEKDDQKATEYYGKAADLGHTLSQALYGYALEHGKGIEKDVLKAVSYYDQAAEKNQKNACYRLGQIYKQGDTVSKDLQKASEYFLKAADQKHAGAMIEVAKMHTDGTYPEKNALEAIQLYQQALQLKPNEGQLKDVYYELVKIYLDFKLKQFNIYKAKHYYQMAIELKEDRVKKFDDFMKKCLAEAQKFFELAQKSEKENNIGKALEQYIYAGFGGISDGYVHVANIYAEGRLSDVNMTKALEFYRHAAEAENPWAYECLGNLFYTGHGVEKNESEAVKYYQLACDHGRIKPLERLIQYFSSKKDFQSVFEYRVKLAEAGNDPVNVQACYDVAKYYEQHKELENAQKLSKTYYLRAMKSGHTAAILDKYNEYCASYEEKKTMLEKAAQTSGEASYRLYLLMKEHSIDQDKADFHLYDAADKGFSLACYEVGMRFYKKKDYQQAVHYFEKSSNAKSCYLLSKMIRDGIHLKKDRTLANEWLYKYFVSKDKTKDEALIALNDFICDQQQNPDNWSKIRHIFESALKTLTAYNIYDERYLDQILLYSTESAINNARWYNLKMADAGWTEAEYRYGLACFNNTYSEVKNHNDAYKYLRRAAEKGHLDAMCELANVIFNGRKEIDEMAAREKFRQSVEDMGERHYNNTARQSLSRYQDPKNIEEDIDKIVEHNKYFGNLETLEYDLNKFVRNTEKLALEAREYDQDFIKEKQEDMNRVIYKFSSAYDNRFNHYEGMEWLKKAANNGHVLSMMTLGLIDIDSKEMRKRSEAKKWLKKAADTGDEEAIQVYEEYVKKKSLF